MGKQAQLRRKAQEGGGCQASTSNAYSFRKYEKCGREPVVAHVRLYGRGLIGGTDYTPMCLSCLVRTGRAWKSIEVEDLTEGANALVAAMATTG